MMCVRMKISETAKLFQQLHDMMRNVWVAINIIDLLATLLLEYLAALELKKVHNLIASQKENSKTYMRKCRDAVSRSEIFQAV